MWKWMLLATLVVIIAGLALAYGYYRSALAEADQAMGEVEAQVRPAAGRFDPATLAEVRVLGYRDRRAAVSSSEEATLALPAVSQRIEGGVVHSPQYPLVAYGCSRQFGRIVSIIVNMSGHDEPVFSHSKPLGTATSPYCSAARNAKLRPSEPPHLSSNEGMKSTAVGRCAPHCGHRGAARATLKLHSHTRARSRRREAPASCLDGATEVD